MSTFYALKAQNLLCISRKFYIGAINFGDIFKIWSCQRRENLHGKISIFMLFPNTHKPVHSSEWIGEDRPMLHSSVCSIPGHDHAITSGDAV